MDIKNLANQSLNFVIKRIIEVSGVVISITGILLFISLITYSPEDPNFIFPDNTEIQNVLGFKGSFVSDIFIQSLGLISMLIPISLFFTGINIVRSKQIFTIIENLFYVILYSIFGSLYFSSFYKNSFWLPVNGNGGFIGNYLENTFLVSIINLNKTFSFYVLFIIIVSIFLISINFKLSYLSNSLKNIFKFIIKKKYVNKISEKTHSLNDNQEVDEVTTPVQENLPFEQKIEKHKITKNKFILPSINLLKIPNKKEKEKSLNNNSVESDFLEKILLDFGVEGKIKKVSQGPVVTLNEFEPAAGVKVSKIINLSEDIARNTSSESARISTIPGRNTIGIELPNSSRENVYLSEILSHSDFSKKEMKLPIALGKNISGDPIIGDLASMPHLLIAGTTGSGKSVCINTIILSLLYRHTPEKCKFILIDPKMLELSTYEDVPHLLCPVITKPKKAASVLGWVVKEMENRYRLMTKKGVRNIDGYNSKHSLSMPYIVVIVDEMSDLMLVAGKEIENYIQKLSQMARAAGIHIIMATQRPSVDVITGTIKANFPTRISFQVTSKIDSRTILGEQGAEQLLGKGDMLFMTSANRMIRIHGPFVSENEIEKINNYLRTQAEPDYVDEILNYVDEKEIGENKSESGEKDDLYQAAIDIIKLDKKASTSYLQRKLQIGYNRAARIMDMMESEGIVSKANHVGKREILK
ncbi:MAG: DNA translocase FtsK [Candidatus Pelagibacter sp.]|nr:DNA translocase FtsK [Candidatus Pelagibacter sp.]|tara:strand:+ start:235 stop:2331 length:2097 start_codon:yes stop_codon:yes gene_type:complete